MPLSSEHLESLLAKALRLLGGSANILRNRESTEFEFKQTFNLGSRAKYAKSMASFANNKGGFLIFGIEPNPHKLRGVNRANFDSFDPSELTRFLNSAFSPEIQWEMGIATIHGVDLGYIHTSESRDKPVVATQTHGDDIKEGGIYFRYRGQCSAVRYPELRSILEERINRERNAWLQHLQVIGRSGPTNVGIIDTVQGRLYGGGAPFSIDETLLRKLKFIRKGQFSESAGQPTLTLMGDLQSVQGAAHEVPVVTGIHGDDLITAFLAQRSLSPSDAKSYLQELAYQNTPLLPMHYFVRLAGITRDEAVALVKASPSTLVGQKTRLLRRLSGAERMKPQGVLEDVHSGDLNSTEVLVSELSALTSKGQKRNMLYKVLKRRPEILLAGTQQLPVALTCEAITHLTAELTHHRQAILQLLLQLLKDPSQSSRSNERTIVRKAVCMCDELLNFIE